jgi:hypothetical protein
VRRGRRRLCGLLVVLDIARCAHTYVGAGSRDYVADEWSEESPSRDCLSFVCSSSVVSALRRWLGRKCVYGLILLSFKEAASSSAIKLKLDVCVGMTRTLGEA